jgi:hypothetical protein
MHNSDGFFFYLCSFVYNLPDDGLVGAETFSREIKNEKRFITDCAN